MYRLGGFQPQGTVVSLLMFLTVSGTITVMTGSEWKRLGVLIVRRRVELGMNTREDLAQATGLSARMLADVEKARRTNFDPGALARIENTLQWQPGSITNILDGGHPVENPTELTPNPTNPARPSAGEDDIPEFLATAQLMWDTINDLAQSPDNDPDRTAKTHRALTTAADTLTDALLGLHVGPPAKPLIQEMAHKTFELTKEMQHKEEDGSLDDAQLRRLAVARITAATTAAIPTELKINRTHHNRQKSV